MSSRNRVAARAAVKAIAAALLVALMCAPAASAQPTQLCSSVTLPMASLWVNKPVANAVFRNVIVNFTAAGFPTTTSPSDCVTPHGTWIVKWEFDWDGDGTVDRTVLQNGISLSQSFTYTALKSGNEAKLRVTDDLGNRSTWDFTLFNIINKPPTASLTGGTGYRNQAITLSGSGSTDVDGPIKTYYWDLDNSGYYDHSTTDSSITHSWSSLGTYTVALQVEDSDGATSPWTRATVTIVNQAPTAAFSCSPAAPKTGETITCTSSSHDPDSNQPLSYEWDTGSGYGYSSWSSTMTVSFSHSGSRTIRLRVTDSDKETAETQQVVTVANRAPVAAFVTDPAPFYTCQLMTQRSTSSDPDGLIAATHWDLDGDGSYGDAIGTTVARRYTTTMAHEIGLCVWDNEGKFTVFRQDVQATVPPPDAPVSASIDRLADTHRDRVVLTWMPSHSGAVKYDVRWRQMLKDASYGPWQTVINGTTNKSARHNMPSGPTACYSVRAYNAAGAASAWSGERCTSSGRASRGRSAGTGTP